MANFVDFSGRSGGATAWVFPGQGSQKVGMGRPLYDAIPAVRELFERADEALGFAISTLCFEGPEEELRRTVNTQPALVLVSLACLRAALERGSVTAEAPAFVAGHSLGEYSALVAAGALDFEDGLRLVRERGRLMQAAGDARPGTLAAILGLDEQTLADVCRETGSEICNINSPGQIVIGGEESAVDLAMAAAKAKGASRALKLNVSGAFHTSLMAPAEAGMREALADVPLRAPIVPVVSNGAAEPLMEAATVREELAYQLCHPVLWQQSVTYIATSGVERFIEFGPGNVLTGLIKRIAPGTATENVTDSLGE